MELYWDSTTLQLDDDTFREAGHLSAIGLAQHLDRLQPRPSTLTLAPGCLAPLTALKTLVLMNCALTSVPSAVAMVGASLTSLSLVNNLNLQLGEADMAVLLKLAVLRRLDVRKTIGSSDTTKPADVWSEGSIQILIDLPRIMMAEHGVAPVVWFAPSLKGVNLAVI